MLRMILIGSVCATLSGCASTDQSIRTHERWSSVYEMGSDLTLETWHQAASMGLFDLYFEQMTDDSIFLGTDSTERWTKAEFMDYAREPFSDGHGWTYHPRDRHTAFNDDFTVAWIDELLDHDKYGVLRGTAVLEKHDDKWLIAHYSLTFLVPNEAAGDVVETIKEHQQGSD
ncbi:MAG: nuclear transport factor 2 family protein [Phycisphaerales bacterium]|nr:nuclear transport factor 2 family protein [Phycisphaerales bacterium]